MTDARTTTPRLHETVRLAPPIAAGIALGIGVVVLIGWLANIELLKSLLHPGRIAMNPTSALAFICCGASLLLQATYSTPALRNTARGLAAIAILVGAWRLLGYLFGWTVGPDTVFFPHRLGANVMAPNTAINFVLVGTALLILDVPYLRKTRQFHPAQSLALISGCIAFLALIGYLFNVTTLYGVGGFIPMALNTALAFCALVIGIVCARPRRQPLAMLLQPTAGGIVARRLLPAAFIVPIAIGWLRLWGQRRELYQTEFGATLMVLANIILFNVLVWWLAKVMQRTDLARTEIETAVSASEERYRAVMEQSAEGIYVIDLETKRVIESNAALDRLLGYEVGETEKLTVYDLVDDSRDAIEARLRRVVDATTPLHGERNYRRKDGSDVVVEVSAIAITYGGRRVACTVVHDITERKQAERALQEKHRQLEEAHQELKATQSQLVQSEKLASLGQMVAGVAHEINNPLSFVSNNVAVLQRDLRALMDLLDVYAQSHETLELIRPQLVKQIRDLAKRIDLDYTRQNIPEILERSREGLRRIQQIVKDLRDFARLDESDLHEADLNAGIESTVNIIRGQAKKKQVNLETQLSPLPMVTCYPAKVNQVVLNLLSNAIDATPAEGKVIVRTSADNGQVQITVSDTGSGIPPDIRQRIFDPFFTTKPQGQGTGLGLSISYGIVRDHGGTIDVDSTPGEGSTFIVHLPLCPPDRNP